MFNQSKVVGSLLGLGVLLALSSNMVIAKEVEMSAMAGEQTSQFRKIEQPLGLKLAVIAGGLGLIGAELWWFMFSNTK